MKVLSQRNAYWLFVLVIYCYLVAKAVLMPLVLDEATSFVEFVQTGLIWPGRARWTTNNHLLNTVLTWVSFRLFGSSEFALRIPNLLAFCGYAIAAFMLVKQVENRVLKMLLVLGLFGNLYILDFFAMERGYGLSFAFFLLALALWIARLDGKKTYWGAELALFFAISANLGMLYLWPVFWLISAFRDLYLLKFKWAKIIGFRLLSAALFAIHVYYAERLSLYLHFDSELGHNINLIQSLQSHLYVLFANQAKPAEWILMILLILVPFAFKVRAVKFSYTALFFCSMFLGVIGMYAVLHLIKDAPLPVTRVSLHLFLLWFPAFIFIADRQIGRLKALSAVFLSALVTFQIVDLAQNFSFHWHKDPVWQREQLQPASIKELKSPKYAGKAISANFVLRSPTQYQLLNDASHFPFISTYNFPVEHADFILTTTSDSTVFPKHFKESFSADRFVIYQNTNTYDWQELTDTLLTTNASEGFSILTSAHVASSVVRVEATIQFLTKNQKNYPILLCAQASDNLGKAYWWQEAPLNHYFYVYNDQNIRFTFILENLPEKADIVTLFLWNQHSQIIKDMKVEAKIYCLKEEA